VDPATGPARTPPTRASLTRDLAAALNGAAARVLDLAASRAPTLGDGRLVCHDGPAGSGKTSLAAAIADLSPAATVVHLDDLYAGWDGLPEVGQQLDSLLEPLARGVTGRYRRYDWAAGRFAETVRVPPSPLLVLEGVGSGSAAHAGLATVTAWVVAPERLRRFRAVARDGEELAERWAAWAAAEAACFAASRVAERADLVVELPDAGSGAEASGPPVP
jgi:hypothetical protein